MPTESDVGMFVILFVGLACLLHVWWKKSGEGR